MIEDKEIKKRELKGRIIVTADLDEKDAPRSRRRQNVNFFAERGRFILLLLALITAFTVVFALINRYKSYDKFKLKWIHELSEGSLVGYEKLGNGFLKYSKDGALYLKPGGKEVWIESYEMSNPKTDNNGKYVIIFDVGGNDLESYTKDGRVATIGTDLPILKAVVSKNGIITILVEDSNSTYIFFYNKEGEQLNISIKSKLAGDGFPTDIALSPDGTALMATFQYLKGSSMMGRVVFYDLSDIGQKNPNRLVGGFY